MFFVEALFKLLVVLLTCFLEMARELLEFPDCLLLLLLLSLKGFS